MMSTSITSTPPSWMLENPEPKLSTRRLNGIVMHGWSGKVELESIEYWVDNRRTDTQVAKLKKSNSAVPSNEQLYDYFEEAPELDIERLAENIVLNGLREPLVLSYDKKLLDGNRRYLAHRWIERNGTPRERDRLGKVDVWVLAEEDSDERGELRVVTEYNFLENFRREWSDFVKAKLLWEEYNNSKRNYTYQDLYELYGGPGFTKNKITEFIRTYEIIVQYTESCPDPDKALEQVSQNFIWFQQLQRSYSNDIRNDEEFYEPIFGNIHQDFVTKTDDLKNLKEMRRYQDIWTLFRRGEVREAHNLFRNRKLEEERNPDPAILMADVNNRLDSLLSQRGLVEKVEVDVRDRFRELAEQVPGRIGDINRRLTYIVEELNKITSGELASVSDESVIRLGDALERIIQQAKATHR